MQQLSVTFSCCLLGIADVNRAFRDELDQTLDRSITVSNTLFDWTVRGECKTPANRAIVMRISEKPSTDALLDHLRQREEQPKLKAILNYLDTYQSLADGCYCVCLPRLDPAPELGEWLSNAS